MRYNNTTKQKEAATSKHGYTNNIRTRWAMSITICSMPSYSSFVVMIILHLHIFLAIIRGHNDDSHHILWAGTIWCSVHRKWMSVTSGSGMDIREMQSLYLRQTNAETQDISKMTIASSTNKGPHTLFMLLHPAYIWLQSIAWSRSIVCFVLSH